MNYAYLESATKNKQTKQNKTNKREREREKKKRKEKNRTEPIYRTKILRLPHTHTHYKHIYTRMHRWRNQKGLIIN